MRKLQVVGVTLDPGTYCNVIDPRLPHQDGAPLIRLYRKKSNQNPYCYLPCYLHPLLGWMRRKGVPLGFQFNPC